MLSKRKACAILIRSSLTNIDIKGSQGMDRSQESDIVIKPMIRKSPKPHLFDLELVRAELQTAIEKLANIGPAVSIFGSARLKPSHPAYQVALDIGEKLSEKGISIITGGGPGVMEAGNRGCQLGEKGESIGLNIRLPREQFPNHYQDTSLFFEHFLTRKTVFMDYSLAYICVPGGFGTLDELLEAITLMQTKKMEIKPVILVDRLFWQPLLEWFESAFLQNEMIVKDDLNKFIIVDSAEEVLAALEKTLGLSLS